MKVSKIFLLEAALLSERHRECVSESEHGSGRGGGRKTQRACLLRNGTIQSNVSSGGESRNFVSLCRRIKIIAGHGDQRDAEPLDHRQKAHDLLRLTAG